MSYRNGICMIAVAASLGVAGCAIPTDPYQTSQPGNQYPAQYPTGTGYPTSQYPGNPNYPSQEVVRYGYVEAVDTIAGTERKTGPGIGAIGGAIAGGAIGTQVGHGSGTTAAVIGGAVLGGLAGHQVEQAVRNRQPADVDYQFRVRMDDGSYQSFRKENHDNIRVGDRVRVERGAIFAF